MSIATLAAGSLISTVIAGFYLTVGRRIAARPVHPEARPALFHFGTWWMALAAATFLGAIQQLLAALGVTALAVFLPLTYVNLFLISIALMGLMYYLVYLFTGRLDALGLLVLFYFAFFLLLVFSISRADPIGVQASAWSVELIYAEPLSGSLTQALLVLLLVPPILGALAFMSLLRTVDTFTQRYRIGLVSTSILLWFSSVYGAALVGLSQASWWPLASDGIGLLAAIAVWAAYLPPGWVSDLIGVEPLGSGGEDGLRSDPIGDDVRPQGS